MRKPGLVLTVMCALSLAGATSAAASPYTSSAVVQASPTNSPFGGADADGPPCNGVPGSAQTGRNFPGTELEPSVAVNPANPDNLIGVWQQDRWSNGGSNATLAGYSLDGGLTWNSSAQPAIVRCLGGTGPTGDYERATDPWVSIGPDGRAYYMTLSLDVTQDKNHAMLASTSTDGGATWAAPQVLRRDTSPNVLNDKNSLTADPLVAGNAYAIWDRLVFPTDVAAPQAGEHAVGYHGPTWFTRTTNGGASWETARNIYDPGTVNQTIGNEIVVTRSGDLVDGFDLIYNFKNAHKVRGLNVAAIRSTDKGVTWSKSATIIDKLLSAGVSDPTYGSAVRTGDIIPQFAADPRNDTVYAVWQDARSTGGARDQVALAKSTDGGRTWTTLSYAINTDHSTQAFTPVVRVAPDGTIGVLHYDFRYDDAGLPLVTSTWLLHSHDGGATWEETQVGGNFDMSSGARARGYFVGDYMGLDVAGTTFKPFFGVANGPTPTTAGGLSANPASNIYSTSVTP